jgi:hypothetical protein
MWSEMMMMIHLFIQPEREEEESTVVRRGGTTQQSTVDVIAANIRIVINIIWHGTAVQCYERFHWTYRVVQVLLLFPAEYISCLMKWFIGASEATV